MQICFVKKYKIFMVKNMDLHGYNMRGKLNFHMQHCNTVIYARSVMNMGTRLYNRILIQIKQKQDLNSFRRESRVFLLRYSAYSVDEFMSHETLSV
jgi:hypothetical protein